MADIVDQVRGAISARLSEIAEEATRLERALKQLGTDSRDGHKAPGRRKAQGNKSKQARRGQRAEQFVAFVSENPGARGAAIAKEFGVAPSQIYALAKRLEGQGKIAKSNGGYEVKSAKAVGKNSQPAVN